MARTSHAATVPYVAQSENLCGGAALAMVLRHWGIRPVHAEDFRPLVDETKGGIETTVLEAAARARGFESVATSGTIAELREQLARGRPVIVLLQSAPTRLHYVVVTGIESDRVIYHDPARGPSQQLDVALFDRRWSTSGRWALVVAPLASSTPRATTHALATPSTTGSPAGCGEMVSRAVDRARHGETAEAEQDLILAADRCPGEASPLRELAGLRLLQKNWPDARRLAAAALASDPRDTHARDLLASSLYLEGNREAALNAWNALGKPAVDLVQIDGLERLPYRIVSDQIVLPPGSLLTGRRLRHARRRVSEIPAIEAASLTYLPSSGGFADIRARVSERPVFDHTTAGLSGVAIRAALDRELTLALSNPLRRGEVWTARWRWWNERPRVGLALSVPSPSGLPGIWRIEGQWDRQAYAGSPVTTEVVREERRHAGIQVEDWWHPAVRLGVRASVDRWDGHDLNYSLGGGPELRVLDDRGAVRFDGEWWLAARRFSRVVLESSWRLVSQTAPRHQATLRIGAHLASAAAPRGLWPAAGATEGRGVLLRAHPLIDEGIVSGAGFGREIVFATLEGQRWSRIPWGLRLGGAVFVDAAAVRRDGRAGPSRLLADAGLGLRLGLAGTDMHLRVDAARSLTDGRAAVSAAWVAPWPGW
jgi:hypothetical protein